jgi:putative ABC transport system permease protein
VAVLTLALGIGITTAMFTVVDGVLLRPLPFPESDRLVAVGVTPEDFAGQPVVRMDHWADIERADASSDLAFTLSFNNVATYVTLPSTMLALLDETVNVAAAWVSEDFFEVLGNPQGIGRFLLRGADRRVDDTSVILGNRLWRSRFGGDSSVVGRTAVIDGVPRTIVGVMPESFDIPVRTDLFLPLEANPLLDGGPALWGSVVARLGEGASPTRLRSELEELAVAADWRVSGSERPAVRVIPLEDALVGDSGYPLMIFSGAVGFVLLICIANVANLLLMRAKTREAEIGLRKVMGADPPRLVRQLLTESLILAVAGGALGTAIAAIGFQTLLRLAPPEALPSGQELGVDLVALGFALVVSVGTGIAFGFAPALKLGRRDLRTTLSGASGTHTKARGLGRDLLVVSEVGLALVLVAGAVLLARSFHEIRSIDPGFDPSNAMSYSVALPERSYTQIEPTLALHESVLDGLASIPGVQDVGAVNLNAPFRLFLTTRVRPEDQPERGDVQTELSAASPGYFSAMGIAVTSGRSFTEEDDASAPPVTVVSRALAELLWPGSDPLGRRIALGRGRTVTVVGVSEDVMRYGTTVQASATMFQPLAQVQDVGQLRQMNYVVRSTEPSSSLTQQMREVMRRADPNMPAGQFASLDQLAADAIGDRLFQARLLLTFAVLAVLLAGIGVYGVMAYSVNERTREMGIRMALGGRPVDLIGSTISRVGKLVLAGILVGTLGAYGMGHALSAWLYSVSPGDPVTLVASVLILGGVALVAAVGPIRRAVRVSPAEVLAE